MKKPDGFKMDQLAFASQGEGLAKDIMARLGGEWIEDTVEFVTLDGSNTGTYKLYYNYDFGIEYELLVWKSGLFWLQPVVYPLGSISTPQREGALSHHIPVPSHIGTHVPNAVKAASEWATYLGVKVAQAVETVRHTNEYLLERNRRYRYVILDTRHILGADLKFIERIEK